MPKIHDKNIIRLENDEIPKFLDTVAAGQILMKIFIENGWYEKYKFEKK